MNGADTSPMLTLQGVSKSFGDKCVLADINLTVAAGETVSIIGPSGSGKTTLLNVLAQIDAASSGELSFQSQVAPIDDPRSLKPGFSCRIGYVTQEDNLLPWRTTVQNVLFPLLVQRRLDSETRARAQSLIRAVGLSGFENHYPHELSGGMRKRASLIRTLVYDPPVILMDEPFGALDPLTRASLQKEFAELKTRLGKTVIFVTHDVREALMLGTRIALMDAGKIVLLETPDGFVKSRNELARSYLETLD